MNQKMPTSLFVGIAWISGCLSGFAQSALPVQESAVKVRVVAVTQQQMTRTTTQPASIEPFYRAEIRSRLSGYVQQVNADIGDVVKQGDTLATLDVPEMQKKQEILQSQILRLQAEEVRAKAGIDVAVANIQSAEASRKQAEAQVAMQDAAFKAATSEFERIGDLVSRGSAEPRVLDEATQRRESASANRTAAMSAITSADAAIAVAHSQKSAAEANLKVAQAETQIARGEMQELEVMIAYQALKAPFDGIVTGRTVDPGDHVPDGNGATSREPLFVIDQIDKVRCRIQIPERDAAFVRRGDVISLTLPAFSGEQFQATVSRTSQTLSLETRTMLIEADIQNSEGKLLPGMFGQATLTMSTPTTASLLPARSVRFDAKGSAFVYVVRPDDTVEVTSVSVVSDDGHTLHIAGLQKDQRVVDAHLQRFTNGQRVQILNSEN